MELFHQRVCIRSHKKQLGWQQCQKRSFGRTQNGLLSEDLSCCRPTDFYPVYVRILGDIEQHKNATPDPIEEELEGIEAQPEQQPQEQAWDAGIDLGSDADESRHCTDRQVKSLMGRRAARRRQKFSVEKHQGFQEERLAKMKQAVHEQKEEKAAEKDRKEAARRRWKARQPALVRRLKFQNFFLALVPQSSHNVKFLPLDATSMKVSCIQWQKLQAVRGLSNEGKKNVLKLQSPDYCRLPCLPPSACSLFSRQRDRFAAGLAGSSISSV